MDSPLEGEGFELGPRLRKGVSVLAEGKRGKGHGDDKRRSRDGEYLKRNRGFASGSLQRRVGANLPFVGESHRSSSGISPTERCFIASRLNRQVPGGRFLFGVGGGWMAHSQENGARRPLRRPYPSQPTVRQGRQRSSPWPGDREIESFSLHRRDANLTSSMRWTKPLSIIPVCACSRMHLGQAQGGFEIGFSPSRSTGDFSRASPPSAFGSWQS